jgi:hypothetical protein
MIVGEIAENLERGKGLFGGRRACLPTDRKEAKKEARKAQKHH